MTATNVLGSDLDKFAPARKHWGHGEFATRKRAHLLGAYSTGKTMDRGFWLLLVVSPFQWSFLLAFPLKYKLLYVPCLARGSLTYNGQNINNDALDRPKPPFLLEAQQAMGHKR